MFRTTRALWMATKAVSDVLYSEGIRDSRLANRIISIHEEDENQLTFEQLVSTFKKRPLRDGVIMHLIQIGAFWLGRSRAASTQPERDEAKKNYRVVTEAATVLARKEYWKESDHRGLVVKEIESACNVSKT